MAKITKLNRANVDELYRKLRESLSSIEEDYGVKFSLGNGRFSEEELTLKVRVNVTDDNGAMVADKNLVFKADAWAKFKGISYKAEHFIGSIWANKNLDKSYKIVDFQPKKRKYPVVAEARQGNRYVLSASSFGTLVEIAIPSAHDMYVWLTVDPDEDSTKQSDVDAYDKTDAYMYATIKDDAFYETINRLQTLPETFIKSFSYDIVSMLAEKVSVTRIIRRIDETIKEYERRG